MAAIHSTLIAEARKRWKKCADAEGPQRARILAAKNFRAGEQWPTQIKDAREGAQALPGVPAQPPRPCLVVDRLSQPVRQTSNTIKNAEFGFDVMPNGGGADEETAEIFKGYLRRVQNNSRGESPIEWAADGAIEGGIGWFRLRTDYVHQTWDGDPNDPEVFDQHVVMERIVNNLTVYCDPSAMRPTRSDAQFLFITEDLDKDEFTRLYPDADIRGLEEFASTGDMKGWVSDDTIRIGEYWRLEYDKRTFCELKNGTIVEKTKDSPKYSKDDIERERVMRVASVKCDKINAVESLEEYDWAGSRIPIIPILGEELNVDGKPILRGIIEEGMDAQRMVNYTYSGAMEIFALAPKVPWVAAAGQIEPYAGIWQTANVYNYSYLPYEPLAIGGELIGPPQRQAVQADIGAAVELMRTSEEAIRATTAIDDPSRDPKQHSGKAIQSLQSQSELTNSNYPDNVRRALIYAGELMVEVIPKITREGQVIQIMGLDDKPEQVMIGKPFQPGPTGVPQPAPDDVTPEIAKLKESLYKFYDLNNGRFAVTVTVGKAHATKREEGAAMLGELIPNLPPPMAAVLTPEYIEQLSMPNAFKMAAMARKALPPELQETDEKNNQIPPQVAAQMQQMQAALQQAQQAIQTDQVKQQATIESSKVKAQADIQSAQIDAQLQIELQKMRDATSIAVAQIAAQSKGVLMQTEAANEAAALHQQQQHDVGMAAMQHGQAQQAAAQGQQHEAAMAAAGQQAQAEQQQVGHAQALEQAQQAADLQPPPAVESGT